MLVIARKCRPRENTILLRSGSELIRIVVLDSSHGRVRIGIDAPPAVRIDRGENVPEVSVLQTIQEIRT